MKYRRFGRAGWNVSEIGYGMWGMGSWTGSDDEESLASLQRAADAGCNFFDTAYVYGNGRSESLLGRLVRANADKKLFTATKIPPKNMQYPTPPEDSLEDCYPPAHIEEFLHKSLENAGLERFDLLQIHTWNDEWTDRDDWSEMLDSLKKQGLIGAVGISLNRFEPWNGVRAVRSGKIDSVQVVYNIFEQNPEDELFPACAEMDVAVIARVPFDEGALTGVLTEETTFPADDWRSSYFTPENLKNSVARADAVKRLVPENSTLPEIALRYILSDERVATVIPGMRRAAHVDANIAAAGKGALDEALRGELKKHRWVRRTPPASV